MGSGWEFLGKMGKLGKIPGVLGAQRGIPGSWAFKFPKFQGFGVVHLGVLGKSGKDGKNSRGFGGSSWEFLGNIGKKNTELLGFGKHKGVSQEQNSLEKREKGKTGKRSQRFWEFRVGIPGKSKNRGKITEILGLRERGGNSGWEFLRKPGKRKKRENIPKIFGDTDREFRENQGKKIPAIFGI